jgi:hypothetical protein
VLRDRYIGRCILRMKESISGEISSQISHRNRGAEAKYKSGATPSLLSSSNIQLYIISHVASQFDSHTSFSNALIVGVPSQKTSKVGIIEVLCSRIYEFESLIGPFEASWQNPC